MWKITNALGQVWEYTYTSYGDVKSVKDPEGAVVQYVYDYELNEPAYGQVRKVIDALNRETVYEYYPADDANLARRGQVKRVIVPGGFWREMDYGGAGWLTRRTVQVANGTEVTTYRYDSWGRLRGVDYPRSADVRMGFDGESRRVWVEDGVGRRQYTYDAWGRVVRQEGYCGSAEGIEVQVVTAEYDGAGRKVFEKERRSDGSVVREIGYTYDGLGRLQSVGDYRGSVVYTYEAGTGRLKREDYPNSSFVEYTYYGSDNPSQVGFVWKVEHKRLDGSLLIGYEYTYDLLGRVVESVERPSGDTTTYTYTPAGRLESEVRTGQVAYSRSYAYNPDGSRAFVDRTDALNGTHWDFYSYDGQTGRLESVLDVWSGEVHAFEWNPEGTLARWSNNQPNSYARVFSYDEEGRLVQIERDYGGGNVQLAYRYGYSGDGVRVWKQDVLNGQEYRYVCRIGCGGVPMRVYVRQTGDGNWFSISWVDAFQTTLWGGSRLTILASYIGNAFILTPISNSPNAYLVYRDRFGQPVASIPDTPIPSFILPMDYPLAWLPSYPRLSLNDLLTRLIFPRFIVPAVGVPMPQPPFQQLPYTPPPQLPPPSSPEPPVFPPLSPPGGGQPEPHPPDSACAEYDSKCSGDDYDWGDCTLTCIRCCGEKCGPAAYSSCAAGCPGEPGSCGITVIDPPSIPEDEWDWFETICELLTEWGLITLPDGVDCKTIQWIQFL